MCTVTYIPLRNSILFSSSRDESPARTPAVSPVLRRGKKRKLFYPTDGASGGTWIGLNDEGHLIILLNGGFENHTRRDSYRHSRGLVIKEMLDTEDTIVTWQQLDLSNIEPFTLIAYGRHVLHQLVWTGHQKFHLQPDPLEPHIWSSATLYDSNIQALRKQWFKTFLEKNHIPSDEELYDFLVHQSPADKENGFNMNRNEIVKTCSVSVIQMKDNEAIFDYYDLLLSSTHHSVFQFDAISKRSTRHHNKTALLNK